MTFLDNILEKLPEVKGPTQKRLGFKQKLKWTLIILVIFFVLGLIPLYGLGESALQRFEFLSVILGAKMGSIISLGIGPIVTASIVLQLLNGSGLVNFDTNTPDGKRRFQGIQKILSIGFVVLEAIIYVVMGGLPPAQGISSFVLIFQLILGGLLILFMDEVVSKWGFGSGISLFIAAGVSQTIFVRALNPLPTPKNPEIASGAIPSLFQVLSKGDPSAALIKLAALASTVLVFLVVVYTQSMKVEIPLSFGRVRGHGVKWPLNFFYTSNIPVILIAALLANLRLLSSFIPALSGLSSYVQAPNIVKQLIVGSLSFGNLWQAFVYLLIFITGSLVFGFFWVQTSGLDADSQADQIMSSGLQIPGFRKDKRVLKKMLKRYITPLTFLGSASVGALAALADLTGALGSGTGILLTVMIVYRLYKEIAQQHMMDMNPMMRKFMGGE